MKKNFSFLTLAVSTVALTVVPMAQAKSTLDGGQPNVVTPNDTFTISVAGFNTTDGSGILLTNVLTATFNGLGAAGAQTFANAAAGSQAVTITTTQTTTGNNITDSISLSVPTNFIPTGTTNNNGAVINDIELDMGFNNGGTNTLDFTPAIAGTPTYTGSINYGTASTLSVTPIPTLSNNNASLSYYEAVSTTATAGLSQFAIKQFNFSITYAAVPEPSTYAFVGAGALALGLFTVRRNRQSLVG